MHRMSIMRPGVQTTTSAPRLRSPIWGEGEVQGERGMGEGGVGERGPWGDVWSSGGRVEKKNVYG